MFNNPAAMKHNKGNKKSVAVTHEVWWGAEHEQRMTETFKQQTYLSSLPMVENKKEKQKGQTVR